MSSLPDSDPDQPAGEKKPSAERQVDREVRNPWFRWTLHFGAPMTVSILFHAAAVLLFSLSTLVAAPPPKDEIGEYEAGIKNLAEELAGELSWAEDEIETPDEPDMDLDSLTDLAELTELDISDFDNAESISDAPGLGFGEGRGDILGIGSGAGEAGSGGFGGGMGRGSRAGGGRVGMWGTGLKANRIVWVIDFSGSIIVAQDDLVRELKRSVARLRAPQAFNVYIFFERGGKYVTKNFKQDLQIAKTGTKRAFYTWIDDQVPMGRTEPLDAIRRALKLEPEVIFFLSDGFFDDDIVEKIASANKRVRARIWCLVFDEVLLQDTTGLPPRKTDGARRLERIANQNRGVVKIITGSDLDK